MGMVSIVCPNTGKVVPTGVLMSEAEFAVALLGSNDLRCPACGRIHSWSKADARLVNEAAPQ
jgi:hypothetical protein